MNALAAECVGSSNPATVTISPENFEHLLKMVHGEPSLPSAALAYSGISTPHPPLQGKWLNDSSATDHMTISAHFFVKYSPFQQPLFVSLPDGSQVPAIGKGSVCILPNMCIQDVLFVPSSSMSNLSVKRMCSTDLCQAIFTSSYFIFQDTKRKREIGSGWSDGHLYYLKPTSHKASQTCLGSASSKAFEWHLPLGHSNLNKLKLMVPSLQHVSQLRCESCELAKHSLVSLLLCPRSRSNKPLKRFILMFGDP